MRFTSVLMKFTSVTLSEYFTVSANIISWLVGDADPCREEFSYPADFLQLMRFNSMLARFLLVIGIVPLPGLYHVTYPRSSPVSGEIASSSSPRLARLRGGSRLSQTHPREAGAQCPRSSKGSSNRGDPGFDRARPLRPCVILGNS